MRTSTQQDLYYSLLIGYCLMYRLLETMLELDLYMKFDVADATKKADCSANNENKNKNRTDPFTEFHMVILQYRQLHGAIR